MNDLGRHVLNKNNSSSTILISQDHSDEVIDNHSVVKRSTRSCELRRIRKWNHCLGRYFTEVHCKRLSVSCLSFHNIPPRCKKNYQIIFGQSRACRVAKSCTCAAWRHCAPHIVKLCSSLRDICSLCQAFRQVVIQILSKTIKWWYIYFSIPSAFCGLGTDFKKSLLQTTSSAKT